MTTLFDQLRAVAETRAEVEKPKRCPECGQCRPDDERVEAGMKCWYCAYGQPIQGST